MPSPATSPAPFLDLTVDDGVATVWLDRPGEAVNTLSPDALGAFDAVLDRLEGDPDVDAVVFISRKPDSFIVGADLRTVRDVEDHAAAEALSRAGHHLVARIRGLDKPTVAAIHGPALGGGLEVALACTFRIASSHPQTRFGLPEVKLGLLPGAGGTQLLPRLIGIQQALGMMLTGRNVYPRKARRIGLVDALTHRHGLHGAAVRAARALADGTLRPERDAPRNPQERLLESTALGRRVVYRQAEQRVRKETRGHYPAPLRVVACVRSGMERGLEAGLAAEREAFADLVFTPQSKQLVFLFFAQQAAKKNPWRKEAREVRKVGILGAGLMGAGIAEVTATNGLDVLLKDQSLELAAAGKRRVWRSASRSMKKRIISAFERDVTTDRVAPVADYHPFADADLVIEAAPEDLGLKRRLLADVEAVVTENCVFASNTSSIPIGDLAAEARRPERVLGMHYFSPVPRVPLLEIIRTEANPDWVVGTAYDAGLAQGKTVIVVNDGPGFYTTRILAIYMNEALALLREGARVEAVDEALVHFGFPMGPFTLFDLVGVDVAAKITDVLSNFFAERGLPADVLAADLADRGWKGQKTGRGFYTYESDGKDEHADKSGVNDAVYDAAGTGRRATFPKREIQDRLAFVMINEAIRCLDDGILRSPRDGDVGAVFGLGFPPFLGGPFRFVDAETSRAVVEVLERLAARHGPQFEPPPLLRRQAEDGSTFY